MASPGLSRDELVVSLADMLRECRGLCDLLIADGPGSGRLLQIRETRERIRAVLQGEPVALLARQETLERVGSEVHWWASQEGIPRQLRALATSLELIRATLDEDLGYNEWHLLPRLSRS